MVVVVVVVAVVVMVVVVVVVVGVEVVEVVVVIVALSTTAVRDPLDTTMYRPDLPTKVRVPKSGARIFEPDFIES